MKIVCQAYNLQQSFKYIKNGLSFNTGKCKVDQKIQGKINNKLSCYKPDKTNLSQTNFYILSEGGKKKKKSAFFDKRVPNQGGIWFH